MAIYPIRARSIAASASSRRRIVCSSGAAKRRRQPRAYWDLQFVDGSSIGQEEAEEELIARLRESVSMRMIADVPLGAFLSGGVDSSAVVAMMAGLQAEPVSTFSISFGTKGLDESPYAARSPGATAPTTTSEAVDPNSFDLLDRLATIYDEPFGDSSAMPTFRVCAVARENVTVALSGDGGDEVFAGYRRYRWHCVEERVRRAFPQGLRGPLFGALGALYPKLDWAPRPLRAKATLEELARDTDRGVLRFRLGLLRRSAPPNVQSRTHRASCRATTRSRC